MSYKYLTYWHKPKQFLGQVKKSLFVLWIALGYANPTEIITEPIFLVLKQERIFRQELPLNE